MELVIGDKVKWDYTYNESIVYEVLDINMERLDDQVLFGWYDFEEGRYRESWCNTYSEMLNLINNGGVLIVEKKTSLKPRKDVKKHFFTITE